MMPGSRGPRRLQSRRWITKAKKPQPAAIGMLTAQERLSIGRRNAPPHAAGATWVSGGTSPCRQGQDCHQPARWGVPLVLVRAASTFVMNSRMDTIAVGLPSGRCSVENLAS